MTDFSFEEISVFLPKYLSPPEQQGLFSQLRNLPHLGSAFYDVSKTFENDLLQSDGWRGLTAINFYTLEKKNISGVIISNSCDVDITNKRDISPNVLFAPIIRLEDFAQLLRTSKFSDDYIAQRLEVIRSQKLTSIFHLPKLNGVIDESIILLDDIHQHPLQDFVKTERQKLFTLSQAAFYLFLIKLSVHFHRINESVHRYIP